MHQHCHPHVLRSRWASPLLNFLFFLFLLHLSPSLFCSILFISSSIDPLLPSLKFLSSSFVVSCPRNLVLGSRWERYRVGSCWKPASEGTLGSCHMAALIPKQSFIRHATLFQCSWKTCGIWGGPNMEAKVLKWDVSLSRMHSQLEAGNWVIKIRCLECWCDVAPTVRVSESQRSRGAMNRKGRRKKKGGSKTGRCGKSVDSLNVLEKLQNKKMSGGKKENYKMKTTKHKHWNGEGWV